MSPEDERRDPGQGDARLLERLRAGDEQAFADLVGRHHPAMVRLARTYVSSDAVAEEVAQEAWLGLLRGLNEFHGRSALRTWLYRILVNRAMSRGVRERRTLPVSSLGSEEHAGPTVDPARFGADGAWATPPRPLTDPQERLEILELRGRLREALAELPPRQRLVLALRDVEGLSTEEVCEILDLTPTNLRVMLHRGRARLQAHLQDYLAGDLAGSGTSSPA